jgi:hypothetical protein
LKNSWVILFFLLLASCSMFKKKKTSEVDAIARVNDEYLYASEIQSLTRGLKSEDSIEVLKSYAETWVRKKLLLKKAIDNIPEDDANVAKKLEDYRESLILYEYEKALINQKLDTIVRKEQLNEWYEKVKNDFPLEEDVFLLFFIKMKKDVPNLDQARKWIMKPKQEEDLQKLEGYCKEFASSYALDKGIWYEKATVLKNFPLNEYAINSLAGSTDFHEYKTEEGSWFIRVSDVLKENEPSPIEFIRDKIVKLIIEKRRLKLVEKTYEKIYQDGIKSKSFEVLVK